MAGKNALNDVVTREYTINLHKRVCLFFGFSDLLQNIIKSNMLSNIETSKISQLIIKNLSLTNQIIASWNSI